MTHAVRSVRWSLFAKLVASFGLLLTLLVGLSSIYIVKQYFDDKMKYVLYSLHLGSESLCVRLNNAPEQNIDLVKKQMGDIDYASVLLMPKGGLSGGDAVQSAAQKIAQEEIGKTKFPNFTVLKYVDQMKTTLLVSGCELKNDNWVLLYVTTDEALATTKVFIYKMASVVMLFLALGFLLTVFLALNFIRPLRTLLKAADEINAGNYYYKWKIKGNDEVSVLSDQIQVMANTLRVKSADGESTKTVHDPS